MTDLVEIVARAICVEGGWDPESRLNRNTYRPHALAALRAIEGAGMKVEPGWQPIETASDDGSMVLIYDPRNVDPDKIELRKSDGGWWRWAKRDGTTLPTHWRPLPDPPAFDAAPTFGGEQMERKPHKHLDALTNEAIRKSLDHISDELFARFGEADPSARVESGWLVEWPHDGHSPPRWWHPRHGWQIDASRGLRFAREIDAQDYIAASRFGVGIFASEHQWMGPVK